MKKLNFLQHASTEEKEVAEKLLQTISFVENRNTVTKYLTNFVKVKLLRKINSKKSNYDEKLKKVFFVGKN